MHVIAIDLGAESGRVMRVGWDGERLEQTEVHRFPNIPVQVCKTLHWDVLRCGTKSAPIAQAAEGAASIGVDAWASALRCWIAQAGWSATGPLPRHAHRWGDKVGVRAGATADDLRATGIQFITVVQLLDDRRAGVRVHATTTQCSARTGTWDTETLDVGPDRDLPVPPGTRLGAYQGIR